MYQPDVRMRRLHSLLAAAGGNQQLKIAALHSFIDEEKSVLSGLPDGPQNRSAALDVAVNQLRSLENPPEGLPVLPPFFATAANASAANPAPTTTMLVSRSLSY